MPRLIRSPEQVIRETGRDIYMISFKVPVWFEHRERIPGRSELLAWFSENLPSVKIEELGPSEFSGVISGGVGTHLWVDFHEQGLGVFCDVWETPDGSSKDSRWQCFLYTTAEYQRQLRESGDPLRDI